MLDPVTLVQHDAKIERNISYFPDMKKLWCVFVYLAFAKALLAQQDPQYTHYVYNPTLINPAYAGSREAATITGMYRAQWVGLDGAPVTQVLTAHSPVGESGVGVGLSLFQDHIGPARETFAGVDGSYALDFKKGNMLYFGLKAGFQLLDVDFNRTNIFDRTDPELLQNVDNEFAPIVGVGLFYQNDRWYAGLSTPNVFQNEHFDEDSDLNDRFIARESIHFYATGGYVFDVSDSIELMPATIVKYVEEAPLQIDLTANVRFFERFTLGAAYRWDAAVSGLAAFQINNNFLVGFAYDREVTDLGNTSFNSGSYEVILRYEIFSNPKVMNSPRFF